MPVTFSGLDTKKTKAFTEASGSIGSAKRRVDDPAATFGLELKTLSFKPKDFDLKAIGAEFSNPLRASGGGVGGSGVTFKDKEKETAFLAQHNLTAGTGTGEDQIKGFIAAFTRRQDEVFGRRAQPGISQTRLV